MKIISPPLTPESSGALATRRTPWALWVFLCCLAIQVGVVLQLSDSLHFPPSAGDTAFYRDWALKIRGDVPWVPGEVNSPGTTFYGMPGYAYLLAGLYSVTGGYHPDRSPEIIGLLQAFAQAGTATFLFLLARRAFGGRSHEENRRGLTLGWLAALLWAFYTPAQVFSAIHMPQAWLVCAFWGCLYWVTAPRAGRGFSLVRPWLAVGLLIGVMSMLVASLLMLLPLICIAIALSTEKKFLARIGQFLAAVTLLFSGVFLGSSPCWIHNFYRAHDPVLFSAHDGVNFYIGNHEGANGYTHIPPELPGSQRELLDASISIAERELGRGPLPRSAVSRFWKERALSWISHSQFSWMKLLCVKVDNYWNAFQYDDLSLLRPLRDDALPFPGLRWAHLVPFALAGLLSLRRWPHLGWTAGALLLILAALLPVFVTERYRLLAAPGLVLLALGGVAWLWERLSAGRHLGPTVTYALLLAAAAFWTTQPRPADLWSLSYLNEGTRYLTAASEATPEDATPLLARAESALSAANAYLPGSSPTLFALGNLWMARKQPAQAQPFFEQSVAANPTNYRALANLAQVYRTLGRPADALPLLREAARLDPETARRWFALAETCQQLSLLPEARTAIQNAVRLAPNNPDIAALARDLAPK